MTHICVSKIIIIGSDNGLSPVAWLVPSHCLNQCCIVNWTLGNKLQLNLNRNLAFKKMYSKMSSGKRRPFCLGLNVLSRPESDYVGYICIARLACVLNTQNTPDSKVHGANMGPTWGRQDPGGPHELCYLGRGDVRIRNGIWFCRQRRGLAVVLMWWRQLDFREIGEKEKKIGKYTAHMAMNGSVWFL